MAELGCLKDGHFNNLEVQNFTLNSALGTSLEGPLQAAGLTSTAALIVAAGVTCGSITSTGNLTVDGAVSGVTTLAVGGAVSGVTTLAASNTITASADVTVGTALTVAGPTTLNGLLHMPLAAGDSELTTATGASVALNPALSIVTAIDTEDTAAQDYSVTLAAGTAGQIKIVFLRTRVTAADTVVITPTGTGSGLIGANTIITLTAVGDSATLYYTGPTLGWLCLSINGATLG
jgi:hypothetical protein